MNLSRTAQWKISDPTLRFRRRVRRSERAVGRHGDSNQMIFELD